MTSYADEEDGAENHVCHGPTVPHQMVCTMTCPVQTDACDECGDKGPDGEMTDAGMPLHPLPEAGLGDFPVGHEEYAVGAGLDAFPATDAILCLAEGRVLVPEESHSPDGVLRTFMDAFPASGAVAGIHGHVRGLKLVHDVVLVLSFSLQS